MYVFISCSSEWLSLAPNCNKLVLSLMFDLGEVQEKIMSSAPQNWFEMRTQIKL